MRMTGRMPTATMMRAASEPCSKLPRGGELVDIGRERLDVERTQEQRRRQFLEAINENPQRRPEDRRLGERQVDRTRECPWSCAEQARDVVELRRNARKSRLREADCDGEEANHVGDDERSA